MPDFRAAVLEHCTTERPFSDSAPLAMRMIHADGPKAGEVLVRIRAASLCRSDLSVVTGVRAWPMPIVPGHEASGIVEAVGPEVTGFAKGDQVVLVYQPFCGTCPCCVAGDLHLCTPGLAANRAGALLSGGPRLSDGGHVLHHHMGLSAFAEMAVVSQHSLVKVPDDVPAEIAALFGCAVMCGAGSVLNTAATRPGESIAIVGVGGVGASAILGAAMAGAGRIIAVDTDPLKRDMAQHLGATDVVAGGADAAAEILELTNGGTDIALEAAGQLAAFETAFAATRRGGRVVTVGLVSPATPFSLDIAGLVTAAKSVTGSYVGSCNPPRDIARFLEAWREGRLPLERLITHRLPLDQVNTALERMAASAALRQIMVP
ncbi:MAG: alcohol dehydrogenase catalytic domain-containing protein [Rhodobacteraceae bacterium]|nr:alcohol dehydrogenase catalytic domain-containing protein [Paracoccaceae bacterium]